MNFGSSVLHIVLEPAMGCYWHVGVVDKIEQLSMAIVGLLLLRPLTRRHGRDMPAGWSH